MGRASGDPRRVLVARAAPADRVRSSSRPTRPASSWTCWRAPVWIRPTCRRSCSSRSPRIRPAPASACSPRSRRHPDALLEASVSFDYGGRSRRTGLRVHDVRCRSTAPDSPRSGVRAGGDGAVAAARVLPTVGSRCSRARSWRHSGLPVSAVVRVLVREGWRVEAREARSIRRGAAVGDSIGDRLVRAARRDRFWRRTAA